MGYVRLALWEVRRGYILECMDTDRFMWALTETTARKESGKHELKCEPVRELTCQNEHDDQAHGGVAGADGGGVRFRRGEE